jgi:hypothetical protein
VWDNPSDFPGEPKFDASANRHVAQRNIHVIAPSAPRAMQRFMALDGGAPAPVPAMEKPLVLQVGRLYGASAQVKVERVAPPAVPWLQLHSGKRGVFPVMAPPTGVPSLSPPTAAGGGFPAGGVGTMQHVRGDDKQIALTTSDDAPGPGEAHVYRVSAVQGGSVFGGYTVIVMG